MTSDAVKRMRKEGISYLKKHPNTFHKVSSGLTSKKPKNNSVMLTPSQNLAIMEGRDPNLTPAQLLAAKQGRIAKRGKASESYSSRILAQEEQRKAAQEKQRIAEEQRKAAEEQKRIDKERRQKLIASRDIKEDMTAQQFQEMLQREAQKDLTPQQIKIRKKIFKPKKEVFIGGIGYSVDPSLREKFISTTETKKQRIIRKLQDKATYSEGGKTYFIQNNELKSIKGGKDDLSRFIEKRVLGADPSLKPIKEFEYGEKFSVRYAHMYLGQRLGDWWIKKLKEEGRTPPKLMEKPAPEFLVSAISELPTFKTFAPFMETGAVKTGAKAKQKAKQKAKPKAKKKSVSKKDVEIYLTEERVGSTVRIHGEGLENYQDKAARVRALLKAAKTPKTKIEALKIVKETYGTDFLKEFVAQGELGFIPIKGTSKVDVPDNIMSSFLSKYDIPVIPKMKGIEFIESPVSSYDRFSVYKKPTNLFDDITKKQVRQYKSTDVLKKSLIRSILDTKARQKSKVKHKIKQVQKPKTAVDTMTDMLTKSRQKLKIKSTQKFKREIPRVMALSLKAKSKYPTPIPLFDFDKPKPKLRKPKLRKIKKKKKKYVAQITGFEAALGLGPRYVKAGTRFTGFEAIRGKSIRKPLKRKIKKKPVKKKPKKRIKDMSNLLY